MHNVVLPSGFQCLEFGLGFNQSMDDVALQLGLVQGVPLRNHHRCVGILYPPVYGSGAAKLGGASGSIRAEHEMPPAGSLH